MEHILEWKCGWMGEWNGVQLMVLRRRRGDREVVEVWMVGRIECTVLRRSRGIAWEESERLQRWKGVQRVRGGRVVEVRSGKERSDELGLTTYRHPTPILPV